jgi:hypothetical protein
VKRQILANCRLVNRRSAVVVSFFQKRRFLLNDGPLEIKLKKYCKTIEPTDQDLTVVKLLSHRAKIKKITKLLNKLSWVKKCKTSLIFSIN